MTTPPRILVIAGSDSSGGAGIQADIKTITILGGAGSGGLGGAGAQGASRSIAGPGGYAVAAIAAVTAQKTLGGTGVAARSAEMVGAQIDACTSDIGVDAVKIGMLGSPESAH